MSNILYSIIMGLVQGVTEFIPVSSSGHLELAQRLLSDVRADDFHLFLEFINLGTLVALLFFYRKKILAILKKIFVGRDFRFALNILITIIPVGLAGILLSDLIEELPFFSSLFTIAGAMMLVGFVMVYVEKLPKMSEVKNLDDLPKSRALIIGLAQVLALVPGTSRSGTSITAGRLVGLSQEDAADYSFIASIPIMTGVCLKMFLKSESRTYFFDNLATLGIANIVAFISGLVALFVLLKLLKKSGSLKYFGLYRIFLASVVIIVTLLA